MTIQFVCIDCGQWMEADEENIGQPAECPQCGQPVPVPEESDRLLAEGACFYCGEPAEDLGDSADDSPLICAECRLSIAENDYELELEQRARESHHRLVSFSVLAFIAIALLILLFAFFEKKFLSKSWAPREQARWSFALCGETGGVRGAFTA